MRILGIVSDTHDSGIALVKDGTPELVIEEERLSRRKHAQHFPHNALKAAFAAQDITLSDIDAIAIPWNVARLRRTIGRAVFRRFPFSLNLLRHEAHPPQRDGIIVLNQRLRSALRTQFSTRSLPPLINVGHHDSHAAVFFVSPYEDATILVMDGYGDDAATSVYTGKHNSLQRQWHTGMFNSLGMLYTLVTQHLGFAGFGDEGKVMSMAASGTPVLVDRFRKLIRLEPGGRYSIDMSYFDFDAYGMIKPFRRKFLDAFGNARLDDEPFGQHHYDIALALQATLEETILHIVDALARQYPSRNLILTGGVALNCVANARVTSESAYTSVWVPPIASDSGAPLGAALWHTHQTLGKPRVYEMTHAYLGLSYSDADIEKALDAAGLCYEKCADTDLIDRTARDLADGRIVGWYQGRFELGPRALGNRSLLADPRRIEMKNILNARIKHRETFRPFAPVVPIEDADRFFELDGPDPFMTRAPRVRPEAIQLIPAGVHVDGTARVQTIERQQNPRYYDLVQAFGRITGIPVLINTSFNDREPIVARPEEAIACYQRTEMDVLVLGNYYCARNAASSYAATSETPDGDRAPDADRVKGTIV